MIFHCITNFTINHWSNFPTPVTQPSLNIFSSLPSRIHPEIHNITYSNFYSFYSRYYTFYNKSCIQYPKPPTAVSQLSLNISFSSLPPRIHPEICNRRSTKGAGRRHRRQLVRELHVRLLGGRSSGHGVVVEEATAFQRHSNFLTMRSRL